MTFKDRRYQRAFPAITVAREGDNYNPPTMAYHGGMALRTYLAAQAMQGCLAMCADSAMPSAEWLATNSVRFADALLAELAIDVADVSPPSPASGN